MSLRKTFSIMPELEALQRTHLGRGCLTSHSCPGQLLSAFSISMALFTKE